MKRARSSGFAVLLVTATAATLAGCTAQIGSAAPGSAALTGAPTASSLAPAAALKQMEADVPVSGAAKKGILVAAAPSTLAAPLATRFTNAKTALETFAFAHSDLGDTDSEIDYVLAAPGSNEFIGYVVFAAGGDDADRYSSNAVAYYSTTGGLLDLQTRASGISDSEDGGDWTNVDMNVIAAQEATLRKAVTFSAKKQSVDFVKSKTEKASIDALPFAALVNTIKTEIEASTFAHADMGDNSTDFVSVKGADGQIAGYILASGGSDDADRWGAAGYALFSATGQLLDRQISTAGVADTMDDDAVAPTSSN